jgi:hypothetical protein
MGTATSYAVPRATWYGGGNTRWGELWTMLHLPYTAMVLGFVAIGAAAAPRISWPLLAGTLVAYFLGLGIGAHFLDQVSGMGSRYVQHWSDRSLAAIGFGALGGAALLGVLAAWRSVGAWLLPFVGVEALCALGYPLARWFGGVFHQEAVFAVSWGSLPVLTSSFAQSRTVPGLALVIAAAAALVAIAELRWSRASRRARQILRRPDVGPTARLGAAAATARYFDRALQALSGATVAIAIVSLLVRV